MSDALEDALKQLPGLFKEREEKLQQQERELKRLRYTLDKDYPDRGKPDDVLHLDIGGTPVNVLRRTLLQVEGSMLASKFSGRWDDNLEKTRDGRIFIDQPIELFLPLINYLRALATHHPPVPLPSPPTIADDRRQEFFRIVEYYGLSPGVFPLGVYRVDNTGSKTDLVTSHPDYKVSCVDVGWYCVLPLDDRHGEHVQSFEVKVGETSDVQIGWMCLHKRNPDGAQGVGYCNNSIAWDVGRSGICSSGTFQSVPSASVKTGSVIRCESRGRSWYVDGKLVASTVAKDGITRISSTLTGTPVPCVSVKGSVEFQKFEYLYY